MVVSSGFMDHVLAYDRSEVYLRANGLIPAAAQQPINNTLNRQQQVSQYTRSRNDFHSPFSPFPSNQISISLS